jgi:predicted  nucleic acid-binding Zn-ribbon protein
MQAQTEQNNILIKIIENHDAIIGKLSNQVVAIRNDVHALQERMNTMELQLGNIAKIQILILSIFAGKPDPNPVQDL